MALVVVGPDWKGGLTWLRRAAAQLGIERDVLFWGPSFGKDKYDLLASADLFICTSRWEGFPFSLIEAMATGRAGIVTHAADPIELVARSGAGRVVSAEIGSIAAALYELAAMSRSELLEHGSRGRRLVAEELNWKVIATTIENGYSQYCAASSESD